MPPRTKVSTAPSTMAELKATLWKAADKLRGSMDASQYKDVALGLIFLKYVSDAFDERREQLRVELSADGFRDDPVSYTHLDVYKRQEQACDLALQLRASQVHLLGKCVTRGRTSFADRVLGMRSGVHHRLAGLLDHCLRAVSGLGSGAGGPVAKLVDKRGEVDRLDGPSRRGDCGGADDQRFLDERSQICVKQVADGHRVAAPASAPAHCLADHHAFPDLEIDDVQRLRFSVETGGGCGVRGSHRVPPLAEHPDRGVQSPW